MTECIVSAHLYLPGPLACAWPICELQMKWTNVRKAFSQALTRLQISRAMISNDL